MVSCVQGALHGRGRNLEGLEEENIDESYNHYGKDDGVKPVQPKVVLFPGCVLFLPEEPLDLLGNYKVKDDTEA